MPITGKTGWDALYHDQLKMCATIKRYGPKASAAIAAAQSLGLITADEATLAAAALAGATTLCTIFEKLAAYTNVN